MNDRQNTARETAMDDMLHLIEKLELPYLEALQQMLAEHVVARRAAAMAEARDAIRKIAAGVGMTVEQVLEWKPARAVPLYRDPATGKTWGGRGRMPDWVKAGRQGNRVQ